MSSGRRTTELLFRQAPEQLQTKKSLEEGGPSLSDRTAPLCRVRFRNSSLSSFLLKRCGRNGCGRQLWTVRGRSQTFCT